MKNREQLEQEIVELEARIGANDRLQVLAKDELTTSKQKLADVSKIALSPAYFEAMYSAITWGIEAYDFSDAENYDTDFCMGYENKVEIESIDLSDTSELAGMIADKLSSLFTEEASTDEV